MHFSFIFASGTKLVSVRSIACTTIVEQATSKEKLNKKPNILKCKRVRITLDHKEHSIGPCKSK
jgi:hypothetical protein